MRMDTHTHISMTLDMNMHTPLSYEKKPFEKKLGAQKLKFSSLTQSVRSSREAQEFFVLR